MKLTLLYFAGVRDLLQTGEESCDAPPEVSDVGSLSRYLVTLHPELRGRLESVRFAVNESFASNDERLSEGDVVALIPPVAGG